MLKLKLNKNETRALKEALNCVEICSSGCVYEEMTKSKKDCDECKFTHAINSILDQISYNESSYENEQAILNTV